MKRVRNLLALLLLVLTAVLAQSDTREPGNPAFTRAELDQMLAPIALYPDALLSQMLMAATYPLEVVEAARWSRAHPGLEGEAAVQAAADRDWDDSVKSLVAFPRVLDTMDQKLEWTVRLGDAFLAQQAELMDAVQGLRQKAAAAGNLASGGQLEVRREGDVIEIEPIDPAVVYVPYYDPVVIYGPWWWPAYPPVYWGPWPGYGWYGTWGWGIGIGVGGGFFFGGWDWSHHHAHSHHDGHDRHDRHDGHDGHHRGWYGGDRRDRSGPPQPWRHDPEHRHSVPYRNLSLNREYGRGGAGVDARRAYRGYQPPADTAPSGPDRGGSGPHERQGSPGAYPSRPDRGGASPPERHGSPPGHGGRPAPTPTPGRAAPQPYAGKPAPAGTYRAPVQTKPHAFEGVGQGPQVRDYSTRGHQSAGTRPAPQPRPQPPPRQNPHH